MYKYIKIILLSLIPLLGLSQQTVRGIILDQDSQQPIQNASIILINESLNKYVISDSLGKFTMNDISVGRQNFRVDMLGYKTQVIPNILIVSGKEIFLNINIQEDISKLNEVIIQSEKKRKESINSMSTVSTVIFDTEKINRFSGGRLDVARLVRNYAGVSNTDDSRNDIVIRGNSPTGVLWRLDGIPIPNPNHFSTSGSTGGPVSAINTNFIKNSDFFTGAFPSEYGNAIGGVFDLGFRNGNKEKFEAMFQLNATSGFEGLIEGPIGNKGQASYLIGYRYSFTGLFGFAPSTTGAVPNYQDLTFKITSGETKLGEFSVFGIGGKSDINFLAKNKETSGFVDTDKDLLNKSQLGFVGISHRIFINKKTFLKTIGLLSHSEYKVNQYSYLPNNTRISSMNIEDQTNTLSLSTLLNTKFNSKFTWRNGFMIERPIISNFLEISSNIEPKYIKDENGDGIPDLVTFSNYLGAMSLIQGYSEGKFRLTNDLTYYLGLHSQYLSFNDSFSLEPRTSIKWQYNNSQSISLAYGLHSQSQQSIILLRKTPGQSNTLTNKNLGFTKSHHYVLAHTWKFAPYWNLKTELYYQSIFNVPVEETSSSYSVLNEGGGFVFGRRPFLKNNGTGYNYGLETTIEKYFNKNYYLLITASLFDSKYTGSDNVTRNSAFNNTYTLNFLGGKEFKLNDKYTLTLNSKISTAGGRYYTPIDLQKTINNNGSVVLVEDEAFTKRFKPYLRWDFKIGLRENRKKFSQEWFLDLLNFTNHQNIYIRRYNDSSKSVENIFQQGFFFDALYRIRF